MFPARKHKERTHERPISPNSFATLLRDRQAETLKYSLQLPERRILALPGGYLTSHDLRRTAATTMQRLGVPESIVQRCLDRTPKRNGCNSVMLARIDLRQDYEAEMRDAWNRLGAHLEQVMAVDDVISMPVLLAKAA